MCDEERGLRGRGAADDGLLARPDRPRRCTLPITALRVIPPSSPAIWLAERPSDQSFFRSSTRSSVQFMVFSSSARHRKRWTESLLDAWTALGRPDGYAYQRYSESGPPHEMS